MCPRCTRLAKAEFDPFVRRDRDGAVRFANALSGPTWPVFRRVPRRRLRRLPPNTPCGAKVTRSIERAGRVVEARRWMPLNPLSAHQMRVENAMRAGRGGQP